MFMNFFRIVGDMAHLLSFVMMFWKLHTSRSVAGISLKTQELYVMVFCARYLDLFWNFLSIYNWVRRPAWARRSRTPRRHTRARELPFAKERPRALGGAGAPPHTPTKIRTRTHTTR